jgi:hypothetical protein
MYFLEEKKFFWDKKEKFGQKMLLSCAFRCGPRSPVNNIERIKSIEEKLGPTFT